MSVCRSNTQLSIHRTGMDNESTTNDVTREGLCDDLSRPFLSFFTPFLHRLEVNPQIQLKDLRNAVSFLQPGRTTFAASRQAPWARLRYTHSSASSQAESHFCHT